MVNTETYSKHSPQLLLLPLKMVSQPQVISCQYSTSVPQYAGFPCGSAGKKSACNVGDLGSIPGLGRFPEEGKGLPLQYSGLENSLNCIFHGVAKSRTQPSDFHFQLSLSPQYSALSTSHGTKF